MATRGPLLAPGSVAMFGYGILFSAIGLATLAFATLARGGAAWVLVWAGGNFLALGVAYACRDSSVFGKRADGSMRLTRVAPLLPFLVFTWVTWHLARLVSSEPPFHRLATGIILARRLLANEMPADVAIIVDLTAEFREGRAVIGNREYLSLPILDAGTPRLDALKRLLERLPPSKTALVHCAQGHGRTALVVACLLLERGLATTSADAIARVTTARPGARMTRRQQAFVDEYARSRLSPER